jgi:hypothetical protein
MMTEKPRHNATRRGGPQLLKDKGVGYENDQLLEMDQFDISSRCLCLRI